MGDRIFWKLWSSTYLWEVWEGKFRSVLENGIATASYSTSNSHAMDKETKCIVMEPWIWENIHEKNEKGILKLGCNWYLIDCSRSRDCLASMSSMRG